MGGNQVGDENGPYQITSGKYRNLRPTFTHGHAHPKRVEVGVHHVKDPGFALRQCPEKNQDHGRPERDDRQSDG